MIVNKIWDYSGLPVFKVMSERWVSISFIGSCSHNNSKLELEVSLADDYKWISMEIPCELYDLVLTYQWVNRPLDEWL